MKKGLALFGASLLALGAAAPATAANIIYEATSTASGSLGGVAFNGAFTVRSSAETTTQAGCIGTPGCNFVINTSLFFDIAGLGTFEVLNPSVSFVNNGANLFGFSEITAPGIAGVDTFAFLNSGPRGPFTNVFQTWDGISALGPVSTNILLNHFFSPSVSTSGGALVFAPMPQDNDATFRAYLLSTGGIPEPATWSMMIVGFGLAGAAMRRRTKVSVRYT